jgi:multidrug efflux pump
MSLLGTVAFIYFLGFTLNTFTLLGLALAVGIVVDDAIMVMENIFRHAEMGKDRVKRRARGTGRDHLRRTRGDDRDRRDLHPGRLHGGVIGKFFLQFGVTLCVASRSPTSRRSPSRPARCAQLIGGRQRGSRERLGLAVDRAFDAMARVYGRVLAKGARRPGGPAGRSCCLAGSLFVFKKLPSEFVPSQDQSRLMLRLQTAVGSDINETDRSSGAPRSSCSRGPR